MAVPSVLKDKNSGNTAIVTKFGQLVTSPIDFSDPVEVELAEIDTVYNFIKPSQGQNIVITDIIVSANKNVSATTPADVNIYQSDEVDSATVLGGIVRPQMLRGGSFILTGLNMFVPEGRWVNATTDDDDILLTIMYYRVPVEV